MKAQRKTTVTQLESQKFVFPINPVLYDQNHQLTDAEKVEFDFVANSNSKWHHKTYKILDRLLRPLYDALDITKAEASRTGVIKVIIREMNNSKITFWAWTEEDWRNILGATNMAFNRHYKVPGDCQVHLIAIIYLLCNFKTHRPTGSPFPSYSVAAKVFGQRIVDCEIKRISEAYINLGYGKDRAKMRLRNVVCDALLANRSPYLEDLTVEFLDILRRKDNIPKYVKTDFGAFSRALASLGIISKPLSVQLKDGEKFGKQDAISDVPSEWLKWCQRWHDTSTLAPNSRQQSYYDLLKVGRWLAQQYPSVVTPEQWTRDLAIEFVAAVSRMTVGEWANATKAYKEKIGNPLSPRAKNSLLGVLRRFLKDCQEWEWIPRHFSPERALATPRSIRRLISPNPRVIADDVWAKLLWAGLNLTKDDLPRHSKHDIPWYPLEMVQAIVIVWLFAGLRSNEIYRLRVGCVRWQKNDVILPGTNEVIPKDAVCYLDIPVNKTKTSYTKPIDRILGEAVEAWEKIRPDQPPTVDPKDGSIAHYLFFYRGRKVGRTYINHSIIAMLCSKAGVPDKDVIGNITSHRARSTIASQLANAKEPMTLFELKEWLGHSDVASTISYTKISPTRLAKSYQDADYFKRNTRSVEVLIDQDAVKTGAAAAGEPWMFYDLGHGYCTYDFFDQCKHRMACAKCNFYMPKDSNKAQILESKVNLQRMLQAIPLTEEERAAVEDGIEAMEKLSAKLADVPTPSGQTPQQLGK